MKIERVLVSPMLITEMRSRIVHLCFYFSFNEFEIEVILVAFILIHVSVVTHNSLWVSLKTNLSSKSVVTSNTFGFICCYFFRK